MSGFPGDTEDLSLGGGVFVAAALSPYRRRSAPAGPLRGKEGTDKAPHQDSLGQCLTRPYTWDTSAKLSESVSGLRGPLPSSCWKGRLC